MAIGNKNLEAQYAKALAIGKTPQGFNLLKQAALGQNDDFDQVVANMALKALTKEKTALQGAQAQQQLAQQGKQTVRDRILAEASQLPEEQGIGRLPAPGMEDMAYAQGGVVGYYGGGGVDYVDPYEQYQTEMGLAPVNNFWSYSSDLEAQKKRQQEAQLAQQGVGQPAATAPSTAGIKPVKAPEGVKKALATVSQPAVPVPNPTKEQKETLVDKYKSADELYEFINKKFGDQLNPIKDQLEKDRAAYKEMKSENVGLALLGAAGALLKPGRSTSSAIGEGLSTLGEYGMKFQPQLLAARQGISAGEVGLAQAQAQAARGNFSTAMQAYQQEQNRALTERELAAKEKLYGAQAQYYGARAGEAGGGLANLKAQQANITAQLKQLEGKFDPESQALRKRLQMDLAAIGQKMAGQTQASPFVTSPTSGGSVFRSSLYGED